MGNGMVKSSSEALPDPVNKIKSTHSWVYYITEAIIRMILAPSQCRGCKNDVTIGWINSVY